MQECGEHTPSRTSRKRRKKRSFRFSTMKELKRGREYKSKKKLNIEEPSSVQKVLEYPARANELQDSLTVSESQDGFQTPNLSTVVAGSDEDHGNDEEEDDEEGFGDESPSADRAVVRRSIASIVIWEDCAGCGG